MLSDEQPLDMSEAAHVAWVRSRRDPALWHFAAMAALAYKRDKHRFLPWVVTQPELDRATAGWLFLWPEGSLYLLGTPDHFDFLNFATKDDMTALAKAICERSQNLGFQRDAIGLDKDFDAERLKCLDLATRGKMAPGRMFPARLLAMPFSPEAKDLPYCLDDGLICLT